MEVRNINWLYYDSPDNRLNLQEWEREALANFALKMSDKEQPFPCIPATIGFTNNQLCYGFAGNPYHESSLKKLDLLLTEYTLHSRKFGKFTSLIVFFETPTELIKNHHVEQFEQLFWNLLSGLRSNDSVSWPNHIPEDPHNPLWEFCFQGEPYFMYCATPSHKNRQSRQFSCFMLAITPRWVLQEFNASMKRAESLKAQIRKRLAAYDSISAHPNLNSYGNNDNYEWKQYFLRDDHSTMQRCPFHHHLQTHLNKKADS